MKFNKFVKSKTLKIKLPSDVSKEEISIVKMMDNFIKDVEYIQSIKNYIHFDNWYDIKLETVNKNMNIVDNILNRYISSMLVDKHLNTKDKLCLTYMYELFTGGFVADNTVAKRWRISTKTVSDFRKAHNIPDIENRRTIFTQWNISRYEHLEKKFKKLLTGTIIGGIFVASFLISRVVVNMIY